jgi:hypothetical protein
MQRPMTDVIEPLILDFLEWLAPRPRAYDEVMDAWRTSCPRLTVWEDAMDRGLVRRERGEGERPVVAVTALGAALLVARQAGQPLGAS